MLEIIILFLVVIASFGIVVWYAMHRSRQAKRNILTRPPARVEPEIEESSMFSAILDQEMMPHITDTANVDIDSEPMVSLSDEVKQTISKPTEPEPKKNTINLSIDDDEDIALDLIIPKYIIDEPIIEKKPVIEEERVIEVEPVIDDIQPVVNKDDEGDMLIAFTIMAIEGSLFLGYDIKLALENEKFEHGDMQMFHKMTNGAHKQLLFSAANMLEPGTFDLETLDSMFTPGFLVFAKLPGPINGLTLFDELYESAQSLAEQLGGILCDETRQVASDEIIEAMRGRILALNFSMHAELN